MKRKQYIIPLIEVEPIGLTASILLESPALPVTPPGPAGAPAERSNAPVNF